MKLKTLAALWLLFCLAAPSFGWTWQFSAVVGGSGSISAANGAVVIPTNGAGTLYIQTTGTWNGQTLTIQETGAPVGSTISPTWVTLPASALVNRATGDTAGITSGSASSWAIQVRGAQVRIIELGTWTSGAVSVTYSVGAPVVGAADGQAKSNGSAVFTTFSTPSAVQSVNTTPGTLSTNNGNALGTLRLGVLVANTGINDAWVATTSGAYMWVVPAGSQAYIPVGNGVTLYAVTVSGLASLTATEYGY